MNTTPGPHPNPARHPDPDAAAPDNATLTTTDGRTALRMERRLAQPPERVWAALTDPAALAQWFPSEVALDLTPGGRMEFRFPDVGTAAAAVGAGDGAGDSAGDGSETVMTGAVTAAEAPRLFAFTWGTDHLSWSLAPDGEGSLLTLVHTFGDLPGAASFASGWHLCLTALGQSLDGERVVPGRDTGELHESYLRAFGLDLGAVGAAPAREATGTPGPSGTGGPSGTPGPSGADGAVKRVRFERQLVRPAETVWEVLSAGIEPVAGLPVPEGFTARKVPAGPVTEVRAPASLTYQATPDSAVRWELGEGTGHGARLVLTQTGPADFDTDTALSAWHARIDELATALLAR
ncbi:SRPBCC family protein [Streptomyces corynorhini]|uniref:Toxin-antitoxin system toxin subunit n=1 Tax=Streptomyces corynorhini TaxID=2282652 RepID=A0A370BEN0_9ACTN|nr:SRPBCC family protein [Streptomyces corynorhini]RDG39132.1 toxin-antitoxin system toxin subunit [Streptomyces corynorhini]